MRMATQPESAGSETWGAYIAQRARAIADSIARMITFTGLTPNAVTVIGFFLTAGVAVVIAAGYSLLGGVLVIFVGLFDMLDGALARVNSRKTKFGAFLDSTLDRYSEALLLAGVLWASPDLLTAMLVVAVLAGSLLVSYARARAESMSIDCEVGLLPRPQRVVLLAAGLITGFIIPALWILAVLTHVTTLQRILHVRRLLGDR